MKDYEQEYEEFWKEIVENEDGTLNVDQVKRELSDYATLIHNISIVYDHVTGGMISKPLTSPREVIDEYEHRVRILIDEAVEEAMEE